MSAFLEQVLALSCVTTQLEVAHVLETLVANLMQTIVSAILPLRIFANLIDVWQMV